MDDAVTVNPPSHTGPSRSSIPQLPFATHPSIIRAQQKDEAYLQQLTEACYDAVRRLLGPHRAFSWGREIHVLAELLYYTITTGSGLQTLGEEYCDIVQASGRGRGSPGILRRGALVLFQAVAPYIAEKSVVNYRDTSVRSNEERCVDTSIPRLNNADARSSTLSDASPSSSTSSTSSLDMLNTNPSPTFSQSLRQRISNVPRAIQVHFYNVLGPQGRTYLYKIGDFLMHNGAALLRLHVALFYLGGAYFQISKRLTGIRYLSWAYRRPTGGQGVNASSDGSMYRALGWVLLMQLGLFSSMWITQHVFHKITEKKTSYESIEGGEHHVSKMPTDFQVPASTAAVLLDEENRPVRPVGEIYRTGGHTELVAQQYQQRRMGRKCPLCLSPREVPTATPCGHVFCWSCITEWTVQKQECPLCRADVAPSSLVVALHASEF